MPRTLPCTLPCTAQTRVIECKAWQPAGNPGTYQHKLTAGSRVSWHFSTVLASLLPFFLQNKGCLRLSIHTRTRTASVPAHSQTAAGRSTLSTCRSQHICTRQQQLSAVHPMCEHCLWQ